MVGGRDRAAMLLDRLLHDREPQAGAGSKASTVTTQTVFFDKMGWSASAYLRQRWLRAESSSLVFVALNTMNQDQQSFLDATTDLTHRALDVLPGVWWKLWYCARLRGLEQFATDEALSAAHTDAVRTILHTPVSELVRDAQDNGAEALLRAQMRPERLALGSLGGLSQSHFSYIASSVWARLRTIPTQESLPSFQPLMSACSYAEAIAFSIRDARMRFVGLNAAAETMLGAAADHLIGKTSREVLGSVAAPVEEILTEVIATGRPISAPVGGRLSSCTEEREWTTQYLPIKGVDRRVTAIAAVLVEVTSQRNLEKRVMKFRETPISDAAKANWAASLRNTLTVFDIFVDQTLSNIVRPGEGLGRLVERVRSFDRRLLAVRDLVAQQSRLVPE
jgi:PAS domain-containing protein